MKIVLLSLLSFYQTTLSPLLHMLLGIQTGCRYPLSCSAYAKQMIAKKGSLTGSKIAIKRLLHCHPFVKQYELA